MVKVHPMETHCSQAAGRKGRGGVRGRQVLRILGATCPATVTASPQTSRCKTPQALHRAPQMHLLFRRTPASFPHWCDTSVLRCKAKHLTHQYDPYDGCGLVGGTQAPRQDSAGLHGHCAPPFAACKGRSVPLHAFHIIFNPQPIIVIGLTRHRGLGTAGRAMISQYLRS